MQVLNKTAAVCASISTLLPSLALAHPGHPVAGSFHSLLHGFEYALLAALAAVVAARVFRRR